MKKFQKKPEIVDAIQWDGTKECERRIQRMAGPGVFADWRKASAPIIVPTRSGNITRGAVGGWVVRDHLGILDYLTDAAMMLGYMPVPEGVLQDSLVDTVNRIVDAKLAAMNMEGQDIGGTPVVIGLKIPDSSFSQEDEVDVD